MNLDKEYCFLLKAGAKDHISSLRNEGLIYCNTIEFFRNLEDKDRGDPNECKSYLEQMKNIELKLAPDKSIYASYGQLFFDSDKLGNIFCLYGVNQSIDFDNYSYQKIYIEDSYQSFGESVLIIYEPLLFIERIKTSLEKLSIKYEISPVIYYDQKTYSGRLSPFHKSINYSYQNEVRLWIHRSDVGHFQFTIGNISDISVIVDPMELKDLKVIPIK